MEIARAGLRQRPAIRILLSRLLHFDPLQARSVLSLIALLLYGSVQVFCFVQESARLILGVVLIP